MTPVLLPLGCTICDDVPFGMPLTDKVTVPEFPVTVAMTWAGVPSCDASAIDAESERFGLPGPTAGLELPPHAAIPKQMAATQPTMIPRLTELFILHPTHENKPHYIEPRISILAVLLE
jgi:hypothetical protein